MNGYKIYDTTLSSACYFRTIAEPPNRKCLIQLTEKCNLHCQHCFVSANKSGSEIEYSQIQDVIIPQFVKNNITKVTLTGGEPFVYKRLSDVIDLLLYNNLSVSICTNATLITEEFLRKYQNCDNIHFNVSLDGFSAFSHGKFRGKDDPEMFNTIITNIKLLGEEKLLNGILVTPNKYSSVQEYLELCDFAKECNAKYVLMNPLSQFGRGEKTVDLGFDNLEMEKLRLATQKYSDDNMEMVYIRFPNMEKKPLGQCVAGKVMYIFTNGNVAFCPYMVFAANDTCSLYNEGDFIIGNVFEEDFDFRKSLEMYEFPVDNKEVCISCENYVCGKGCYAARISQGKKLTDSDEQLCPLRNNYEDGK